jgi:hypothetical protein
MVLQRAVSITMAASLAMALAIVLAPIAHAASPVELEACFLDHINAARAADGTAAMTMSSSLSVYGRAHSDAMANDGTLFHSTPSQLAPVLPQGWQAWSENVGYATGSDDCSWLFEGFWESPNHRANLLNPAFDTAGIGVLIDATDTMWTTHVFVQTAGSSPTTTTLPATTTSSPTTSTTLAITTTTTSPTTSTIQATTTTQAVANTSTTSTIAAKSSAATTIVGEMTTSSIATIHEVGDAPAITDNGATTPAEQSAVDEMSAAGIDPACTNGCRQTTAYAMFLMAVAVIGGAISWLAFRS